MSCFSRLYSLERKKKQSVQEQQSTQELLDAFIQIFPFMYDREPTQEEIENERQDIMNRKPADIKQTAAEIEKMVYSS